MVAAIVEHEVRIVLARNALWPPWMFALITDFLDRHDPDAVWRQFIARQLEAAGKAGG